MGKIKILKQNGEVAYPLTMLTAILNPETGLPINMTVEPVYKINNQEADDNGNFTITATGLGAAPAVHTHAITDVTELQTALDGKANTTHTHDMVSGITVGSDILSGSVVLTGGSHVSVTAAGSVITITVTPYIASSAESLIDAANAEAAPIKVFTGTAAEWDAATKDTTVRYLVLLHE